MPLAKTEKGPVNRAQPTLTDAARLAGVSPMTVSRVVNGSPYVSATLRRKVERILDRLDYSPNKLARSLKGNRTNIVGLLLPDLANPLSAELARGIEDSLAAHGYFSFVISAAPGAVREQSAIQAFSDHRVAGAILAVRSAEVDMARLTRNRFPTVTIGPEFAAAEADNVSAAYRKGGGAATAHLIQSGRRRIAFIGAGFDDPKPPLRFRGYLDALSHHGIAVSEELIIAPSRAAGWCSDNDGYVAMQRLLALPCPPDAVFARNDHAAIGALRAMHEQGVKAPGDIAVAGFDNTSISSFTSPALTTVDPFVFKQGKAAVRLLLERVEGARPRQPLNETFPCELVIRQSTALKSRTAA